MKLSILIKDLQKILDEDGDLDIEKKSGRSTCEPRILIDRTISGVAMHAYIN